MKTHSPNEIVFKMICLIYVYMICMTTAGVISCERKNKGECGEQWTQVYTVTGGALTTLWAYITDNPIRSEGIAAQFAPDPVTDPNAKRTRTRTKKQDDVEGSNL